MINNLHKGDISNYRVFRLGNKNLSSRLIQMCAHINRYEKAKKKNSNLYIYLLFSLSLSIPDNWALVLVCVCYCHKNSVTIKQTKETNHSKVTT